MNAITDVKGVEVGQTTLISGSGKLEVGKGPIRTGVTAILPKGKNYQPVFAGWTPLNGNGEFTGAIWVEESSLLEGPILITNTHSGGVVRDAVIAWIYDNNLYDTKEGLAALPVVGETYDGYLNDINGFHVKKEHVFAALNKASSGPVEEGSVGGGTGMIVHQFKGGIGTSSRKVSIDGKQYMLGVLVQANHGKRETFYSGELLMESKKVEQQSKSQEPIPPKNPEAPLPLEKYAGNYSSKVYGNANVS